MPISTIYLFVVVLCVNPVQSAANFPDKGPDRDLDSEEEPDMRQSGKEEALGEKIPPIRSESTIVDILMLQIIEKLTDMNNTMEKIKDKMEEIDGRLDELEKKGEERFTALSDHTGTLEKKMAEQAAVSSYIKDNVIETLFAAITLKARQEAQISEIRLISLYKVTGQNNPQSDTSYSSDLVVDGMMAHGYPENYMRIYSHSETPTPGNKLWIKLGGLFRINKVQIWNMRFCCQEELIGARVYADSKLIGAVIHKRNAYDFVVADEDAVYARGVTLVQPLGQTLHIIELQVWGTGPYLEDDKFS